MNNQFYSTALNKHVYVHFETIVALGDQPERRQITIYRMEMDYIQQDMVTLVTLTLSVINYHLV